LQWRLQGEGLEPFLQAYIYLCLQMFLAIGGWVIPKAEPSDEHRHMPARRFDPFVAVIRKGPLTCFEVWMKPSSLCKGDTRTIAADGSAGQNAAQQAEKASP
jgi:hypothetical protein